MLRMAGARIAFFLAITSSVPKAYARAADIPTRAAARTLGESGLEAYAAGDYETASRRLEQSFQLLPVPTLGLWSARALLQLGKLLEARDRLEAVKRLPPGVGNPTVQRAARADAEKEARELAPRIPTLQIQLEGVAIGDVVLTLDDAVLSPEQLEAVIPLNPGTHRVLGKHGLQLSEVSLKLAEGEHERAILRFSGAPASVVHVSARADAVDPAAAPIADASTAPRVPAHWCCIRYRGLAGAHPLACE